MSIFTLHRSVMAVTIFSSGRIAVNGFLTKKKNCVLFYKMLSFYISSNARDL